MLASAFSNFVGHTVPLGRRASWLKLPRGYVGEFSGGLLDPVQAAWCRAEPPRPSDGGQLRAPQPLARQAGSALTLQRKAFQKKTGEHQPWKEAPAQQSQTGWAGGTEGEKLHGVQHPRGLTLDGVAPLKDLAINDEHITAPPWRIKQ